MHIVLLFGFILLLGLLIGVFDSSFFFSTSCI
jgi:hypothetical protein